MASHHKSSITVVKAFAILDLLASANEEGISLSEASGHLQVSKSTAHRYLTTLEELRVVTRDEKDHFRLGPKLIELAGSYLSDLDLRSESKPFLERLSAETHETVHLAIPSEYEVIYIAKVDSHHSVRMASRIGARNPMYCTSLGKAIMAYYTGERVEEIIRDGLPARTPHTLTTAEALKTELEHVKLQGFAVDDQENEMGVRCVGAPIFDYNRNVVAAVSVSGPSSRLTKKRSIEVGPQVSEAALGISKRIGYKP